MNFRVRFLYLARPFSFRSVFRLLLTSFNILGTTAFFLLRVLPHSDLVPAMTAESLDRYRFASAPSSHELLHVLA